MAQSPPRQPGNPTAGGFLSGQRIHSGGGGPSGSSYSGSSGSIPTETFNAAAPIEGLYDEIRRNFQADRTAARRKIIRFGPKVAVRDDADVSLRDKYLGDIADEMGVGRGDVKADYEAWAPEANREANVRGEGIYQAGYTGADFKKPVKAFKREFKNVAKAYAWNSIEKSLVSKEVDERGRPKYTLTKELNEWKRTKGYLESRLSDAVGSEAGSRGASALEIASYLSSKKELVLAQNRARSLQNLYAKKLREGTDTLIDKVNADNAAANLYVLQSGQTGKFVGSFEGKYLHSQTIEDFEKATLYINRTNALLAGRVPAASMWLNPTNGHLWEYQKLVDNPFGYLFKNVVWKKGGLSSLGIKGVKGLGLGDKVFDRLGVVGQIYKKGIGKVVGKAVKSVVSKVVKKIVQEGIKWAVRAGLDSLGQVIGSFVPVLGNVVAFIVTEVITQIVTHPIKFAKRFIVGACLAFVTCFAVMVALVAFIIMLTGFLLGADPSKMLPGFLQTISNVLDPNYKFTPCSSQSGTGAQNFASPALVKFAYDTGAKLCVPGNLILAEITREAPQALKWGDGDWFHYTTVGWEGAASIDDQRKGYCFQNTSGAEGIGQFIFSTWYGGSPSYADRAGQFNNRGAPGDRCNAEDSIAAMAMKLKSDSGTSSTECTNWDQATVFRAAGRYCGNQCVDQEAACGVDYCGGVYAAYLNYASLSPGGSPCSATAGPGNPVIADAMAALIPSWCVNDPNLNRCLAMVEVALTNAGYKWTSAPASGTVAGRPANEGAWEAWFTWPSLGYQQLTLANLRDQGKLPEKGDIAVWDQSPGVEFGHIGIVWDATIQAGKEFVYVMSNLDCGTGLKYTTFLVQGDKMVPESAGGLSQNVKFDGFLRATAAAKK